MTILSLEKINSQRIINGLMQSQTHTLVISDIHIGSAISASAAVLSLLQQSSFKRLILLGDIFDGPHVQKLTPSDEQLLSYIGSLIGKDVEVVWVRGNHDRIMNKHFARFKNIKMVDEYCWTENGKKYCALHGHQFDIISPKKSSLGHVSTRFHSLFATVVRHKKTVSALEKMYSQLRQLSKKVSTGAIAYADERGLDYVICAHTHESMKKVQRSKQGKDIHYFNTGSWIRVPYSYLTIDEKGVEVKLYTR